MSLVKPKPGFIRVVRGMPLAHRVLDSEALRHVVAGIEEPKDGSSRASTDGANPPPMRANGGVPA